MSGAFSRFEYYEVLDDIEKYIGYLKGNELCTEYLRKVEIEFPQEGVIWPIVYESPCPVSKWQSARPSTSWSATRRMARRSRTPAADAEQIYTTLTETLQVEYLQAFRNAFEQLSSGAPSSSIDPGGDVERQTFGGDGLIEELASLPGRDWFLPEIAGNTDLDEGSYGDL